MTQQVQDAFRHLHSIGVPVTAAFFAEWGEDGPYWNYFLENGTAPSFPPQVDQGVLDAAMDSLDELPHYERFEHGDGGDFHVDYVTADQDHLAVDVQGYGSVCISRRADGLAVDIYPLHIADGPVASCWAPMGDLMHSDLDDLYPKRTDAEPDVTVDKDGEILTRRGE